MRINGVGLCLLLAVPLLRGGEVHDHYSLRAVQNAVSQYKDGVHLDYTDKQIDRLGDRVSIALLKLYDEAQLNDPETVRSYLPVILEAFRYPQLIAIPEDKEPRVTDYLLRHAEREVRDPALKREISDARKAIHDLTARPVDLDRH